MSVLPIKPNLAERARISTINLDDYQLDPLTPPPSPSSPFSMAAYQRMIAETDPTQREEDLTAYGTEIGQNSVPVLETFLTVCTTRLRGRLHTLLKGHGTMLSVDELITQLRQVCEDAEDRANNAQEKARRRRKGNGGSEEVSFIKNFRGTEGAVGLTRWFEKLESPFGISNVAEGDRVKFASSTLLVAMFIQKYCPHNEVKQMENELWNLKGNVNLVTNQLICIEAIGMARGLMYHVVQWLSRENFGDKRKYRTETTTTDNYPNITTNLNRNKVREARWFTDSEARFLWLQICLYCGKCGRHHTDACPPTCHNYEGLGHRVQRLPRPTSSRKAKEDRNPRGKGMKPTKILDNQRQNQGNPKGSNQASTSTQGGRIALGRVYSLCAEAAVKDNNVVNVKYSRTSILQPLDTNYGGNHLFRIDLLLIELGSFDVIFGMDWIVEHRAEVVCYEKYIRVPYGNDMLIIQGKEVFAEDLPGLPPTRQVEFHIELIPGAAPVTCAPYHLAPAEMKELAEQLKKLSDKVAGISDLVKFDLRVCYHQLKVREEDIPKTAFRT
ncbi:hypothetical protein Tco_0231638 [Tanacetum coccineum]